MSSITFPFSPANAGAHCRKRPSRPLETPDQVRGGFGSEPQNHLRDDVALDLVRSAIHGRLAHVEIGRRGAVCIVWPDRLLIFALFETAKVRSAILVDRLGRRLCPPLGDCA